MDPLRPSEDPEEDEAFLVCCLSRQCGLCGFLLDQGDGIIIAQDPTTHGASLPYPLACLHVGLHVAYRPCNGCCSHEGGFFTACHVGCAKLVSARRGDDLDALLKVAATSFEPTTGPGPRELWLQRTAAAQWRLPASSAEVALAPEVRMMVAEYLLPTYAVTLLMSLMLHEPSSTTFDLSLPIAMHHVPYEGQHYVRRIEQRIPCDDDDSPTNQAPPKAIYIAESPHGIRNIYISRTGAPPPRAEHIPGIWWKTLPIRRGQARQVTAVGDGYKLRHLLHEGSSTRDLLSWTVPRPVTGMRGVEWRDPSPYPLLMKSLRYNYPGITGISVRCSPDPDGFHVHTAQDDHVDFYKSTPDLSVWVYMPMAAQERIVAIWMRPRCRLHTDLALAFVTRSRTGRRRVRVAGAEGTRYHSCLSWELIDTPSAAVPSQFFYDVHPQGIRRLLFPRPERPPPSARSTYPPPLAQRPTLISPRTLRAEPFYWSSASLERVATIRRCCRTVEVEGRSEGRRELIGLLLTYEDGNQGSVGHVRWDGLGEPETVLYPTDRLWIAVRRAPDRRPYFSEVHLSPTEPSTGPTEPTEPTGSAKPPTGSIEGQECFQLTWSGILEWWYSYRQCQIQHDGRISLDMF